MWSDVSWQLVTVGLSITGTALRFGWRAWRKPATPSLAARFFTWLLYDMRRREVQIFQKDRHIADQDRRLAVALKMIEVLQEDLDRAAGIDSLHTSRETDPTPNPSSTPMQNWTRRSSDTTG